ncbi:predicted protein [Postia placenta Mad-698-R]|uniref:Uncharacterized protein n=1 Tax=Postia placenta MAD-698-R-SB12 TaxID=670580 RepID=A0A1X6MRC0_9APHY|nr:hypothetical protein POSPLADRAFT_1151329 [Postia placenta MAD-698-R-SB12]EED82191.1 predicted protein [Postia placenta Mad-698-R]OSX58941.1 hypothetical protein POSPLADRAFT_1151329 [Postia placenta MAD-698-R-SB12]
MQVNFETAPVYTDDLRDNNSAVYYVEDKRHYHVPGTWTVASYDQTIMLVYRTNCSVLDSNRDVGVLLTAEVLLQMVAAIHGTPCIPIQKPIGYEDQIDDRSSTCGSYIYTLAYLKEKVGLQRKYQQKVGWDDAPFNCEKGERIGVTKWFLVMDSSTYEEFQPYAVQ